MPGLPFNRSEDQIRAYFKSGGAEVPAPNGRDATNGSTLADLVARFPPPDADTFKKWFPGLGLSKTACDKPRCWGQAAGSAGVPTAHAWQQCMERRGRRHLHAAAPQPANVACIPLRLPRLRVLCFPNAGNAEDMYTSEGTGVRRAPSPLLVRVT